jgi:hypothetical protein
MTVALKANRVIEVCLRIKHDGTYNSGGYVRQGITPTEDPRQE